MFKYVDVIVQFIQSPAGLIISFISGIASIAGLIVAFYQLHGTKTKLSTTQKTLGELNGVLNDQKVDVYRDRIINIEQRLSATINNVSKNGRGRSNKDFQNDISAIIGELNNLDNQLPSDLADISEDVSNAVSYLRDGLENNIAISKMRYADGYLKVAIGKMKRIVEDNVSRKIDIISRANT